MVWAHPGIHSTRGSPGLILVVEDESLVARALSHWVLAAGWRVRTVASVQSSRVALNERIDGALVDLGLPDGSGFEVIDAARRRQHDVPILVLTGGGDTASINRAQRMGVEYACKPADAENVRCFLRRCETASRRRLDDLVATVIARHRLTPAESRIVRAAVECATREALSETLGLSFNTIKTQVHAVLVRTGAASLEELVAPIRRVALRR
jgi:DNA-binding NarL/FixJ family response regulator